MNETHVEVTVSNKAATIHTKYYANSVLLRKYERCASYVRDLFLEYGP